MPTSGIASPCDIDPRRWQRCMREAAASMVAQGLDPKTVQTLLGHSELEMTELYLNDRGLSRNEWKRVEVAAVD